MTIRPIETKYAGYVFRSRTEARHAVFLDALHVPWLYEPEGYVLDGGVPYLPDFLLYPGTDWAMWLEIKAQPPSREEVEKCIALAEGTGVRTYLYFARNFTAEPYMSHIRLGDFFDEIEWVEEDDGEWTAVFREPRWMRNFDDTAVAIQPMRSGRHVARAGQWWWMDCPHCGRVRLTLWGQVGCCPDLSIEEIDAMGHPWPSFSHRTPRLLKAYTAAKSARFEYGESGAR